MTGKDPETYDLAPHTPPEPEDQTPIDPLRPQMPSVEPDPDEAPRCPECGYSLFGLQELRCPECGYRPGTSELEVVTPDDTQRALRRAARRESIMATAGITCGVLGIGMTVATGLFASANVALCMTLPVVAVMFPFVLRTWALGEEWYALLLTFGIAWLLHGLLLLMMFVVA